MVVIIGKNPGNLTNFYTQKYKGMNSGVAEGRGIG
jgi:hypothetical protein